MRRALPVTALLVVLIAAVALVPGAGARPAATAVIPNGTYGALSPRGEYVVFEVRNRKVRNLNFNIQITCQAPDSPSEQRFFSAGPGAPEIVYPSDTTVLQYTHTGTRYLLGYGQSFFGIWDRQNPTQPVERFPRTDDGWGQAWRRYTQIETNYSEVR